MRHNAQQCMHWNGNGSNLLVVSNLAILLHSKWMTSGEFHCATGVLFWRSHNIEAKCEFNDDVKEIISYVHIGFHQYNIDWQIKHPTSFNRISHGYNRDYRTDHDFTFIFLSWHLRNCLDINYLEWYLNTCLMGNLDKLSYQYKHYK